MQVVLLHALPLDGSMWANLASVLPDNTIAPTLYGLGTTMQDWAGGVLDLTDNDHLVVVGNSVGGSCALEIAAAAPERVEAIVLIGAKANHRPQPDVRDAAVQLLRDEGIAGAWPQLWAPLFGQFTDSAIVDAARTIALRQDVNDIINGVQVFHGRRNLDQFGAHWPKPMVMINGALDTSPSPNTAIDLAKSAKRGVAHIVAGCGHYVSIERSGVVSAHLVELIEALAGG
jgi:pimeloyl-[acyl-carrier protein] methyl ester esterase